MAGTKSQWRKRRKGNANGQVFALDLGQNKIGVEIAGRACCASNQQPAGGHMLRLWNTNTAPAGPSSHQLPPTTGSRTVRSRNVLEKDVISCILYQSRGLLYRRDTGNLSVCRQPSQDGLPTHIDGRHHLTLERFRDGRARRVKYCQARGSASSWFLNHRTTKKYSAGRNVHGRSILDQTPCRTRSYLQM